MSDLAKIADVLKSHGWSAPAYIVVAMLRRLRACRTRKAIDRAEDNRTVFSLIYENRWWDAEGESASGPGSTTAFTELFRSQFEKMIADKKIRTLFDAPCGDWNWMRNVKFTDEMTYIGADIVPELVADLKHRFEAPGRTFVRFDITSDRFPAADLWLCRDCLAHLSFADARRALENFCTSQIPYAALSSYIIPGANVDIRSGGFREFDLTKAPFNLPPPEHAINDWPDSDMVRKVGLWRREEIVAALASSLAHEN